MPPTSTTPTEFIGGGSSPKTPSGMLEHYLNCSPEIFERLSLDLSPLTNKWKKKAVRRKTKQYLDDWDKAWVSAGKSDSNSR